MVIHLSPGAETRIRTLMESGGSDNPETIINEALRVLEERDQRTQLKAAIAVGIEQIERGEIIPWTPDALDRLKREAAELIRLGKPCKPEVIP